MHSASRRGAVCLQPCGALCGAQCGALQLHSDQNGAKRIIGGKPRCPRVTPGLGSGEPERPSVRGFDGPGDPGHREGLQTPKLYPQDAGMVHDGGAGGGQRQPPGSPGPSCRGPRRPRSGPPAGHRTGEHAEHASAESRSRAHTRSKLTSDICAHLRRQWWLVPESGGYLAPWHLLELQGSLDGGHLT